MADTPSSQSSYECEKHGLHYPLRFCCACTREAVETERDRYREALERIAAGCDFPPGNPTYPALGRMEMAQIAAEVLA